MNLTLELFPMPTRQLFSSRITTILTMVGVSVGLGNIWRFPYMMGQYGGSAFLIIYLLFSLLFAIPAVMAEWGLGRASRKGPLGAFTIAFGTFWGEIIGFLLLITVLIANSYYLVIISQVAYSSWFSAVYHFSPDTIPIYTQNLNQSWRQYVIAIIILGISMIVVYKGLKKGIEAISKMLVPFFGLVIIYLVGVALTLDGAIEKLQLFLQPDFATLTTQNIFAALGQAFFSLGLGGTFLLIYGSYLSDDYKITSGAIWLGIGDIGAAFLASLFIVPSILVFNLDMTSGPRLIFETLPHLFSQMPGGIWVGSLFLLALLVVAFLSNIAALEVLAGGLVDIKGIKLNRNQLIIIIGISEACLILPSCIYPNLIGILDMVFGSGMQVLGSALSLLALGWGMGKITTFTQIFRGNTNITSQLFLFSIRWVIPSTLFIVLILYIYNIAISN